MHRRLLIAIALVSGLLQASCSSVNFNTRIEYFGKYVDSTEMEQAAEEMSWADAEDVDVYIGEGPEGVDLTEDGLVVNEDEYEVIAKVNATAKKEGGAAANFGFWVYDHPEDQEWRKGYCAWQVPFCWLTLSMWSLFVPLYWPCRFHENDKTKKVQARKMRIINNLKKATKAAGGDILVITGIGQLVFIDSASEEEVGGLDMMGAEGYVIRTVSDEHDDYDYEDADDEKSDEDADEDIDEEDTEFEDEDSEFEDA
jgi:hypothetical protein